MQDDTGAATTPRALSLALVLCALAGAASAHDTWFERLPPEKSAGREREVMLALGTGNRFPVFEYTVGAASLQHQGCRGVAAGTDVVPLQTIREAAQSLIVRVRPQPPGAITCWAQQQAFEVEIAPQTVEVYFKDINASAAVREAWGDMRSRGVAWKERYAKHARIELADEGSVRSATQPVDMAMDVLLESGLPVKVGGSMTFQVLRDGQPLPELAVELRSDVSPIGIWKKTDAQGRVVFQPPLAGHWLLRGTDLRVSTTVPDTWDSRFVTLAFEVK